MIPDLVRYTHYDIDIKEHLCCKFFMSRTYSHTTNSIFN